jgi:hypothetical protein
MSQLAACGDVTIAVFFKNETICPADFVISQTSPKLLQLSWSDFQRRPPDVNLVVTKCQISGGG